MPTTAAPNRSLPFVDWYLLPESYSTQLVNQYIDRYALQPGDTVLDPFAGAGTTVVAARLRGLHALGVEINPFLAFAARVKTQFCYDLPRLQADVAALLVRVDAALAGPVPDFPLPTMPRLERWIYPHVARRLLSVRAAIAEIAEPAHRDFCLLALAAILRRCSNMKLLPHSFGTRLDRSAPPIRAMLAAHLAKMLADVAGLPAPPEGYGEIMLGDARALDAPDHPLLPAALAVTSPPYLNNLDYTMQTRLELFFLGFVDDIADVRRIRKRMLVCDAKAVYPEIEDYQLVTDHAEVAGLVDALREKHAAKNWGWDYPLMVGQYFGGMRRVLAGVHRALAPGGRLVLITGESAHSGILVPVPRLTAELGELTGFRIESIQVLRTRRSPSHGLPIAESAVTLLRE